ncbi:MAG: hypothetical protein HY720_06140 [Planctomycetes bacterium]|nr:hypothetical protein [Planctomycetota bacterium]
MRLASLLVLGTAYLLSAGAASLADEPEHDPLPDGMKGFSGELSGTIVSTGELGIVLAVERVGRVWEKNEAPHPGSAVGKKLLINVQWVQGDDGNWHPFETHVRFFRTLRPHQKLMIEVVNDEGERLHVLELTEEQRERASRGGEEREGNEDEEGERHEHHEGEGHEDEEGERHKHHEGEGHEDEEGEREEEREPWKGFSGLVRGVVREKSERNVFFLHVEAVEKVWRNNKAHEPESLAGRTIRVLPQVRKGDDGRWRQIEAHVRFVRRLEVGDAIRVEVVNDEGDGFHILELPRE